MTELLLQRTAGLSAYELVGAEGAPVVLAIGGISATRHVVSGTHDTTPGWWDDIVGDGRAIDTTSVRVLGVDFIDGGRARDGRPASIVTTHDQAAQIVAVLDELEIDQLDAVVGASYGGMVALALAERWPERVRRVIVVSAAHEPHPMSVGLRAVQRRVVQLGIDTGRVAEGMALGRAIAMTTYRTAAEFSERFDVEPTVGERSAEFEVERYLMQSGDKFASRMRAERFLALSLSVDLHHVVPEEVRVPTTIIAAEGDTLAPPSQLEAMCARLPHLDGYHLLPTLYGHDAFLTEPERLGQLLSRALAD
ncbi:MAG: homoserine O-succinyltransferase [Gemmatimonadota bacterium]